MRTTSIAKQRRKISLQRKNLFIATTEGIPSTIFQTLLGGPFLTGYLLYLGAGSSVVGFVLAITTLVNVAQVFIAYMIQKLQSRKWALVIFVALHRLLWSSTGLIPFLFDKEWWVPVFIILYTSAFLANTVVGVLWASLISDIVPAGVRGRYFGIRNTFLNALGSIMLFVGGRILDSNPESTGFMILFILVWIFAIANIASFFFYPDLPFERSKENKLLPMMKKPFHDKPFMKSTIFLASWLFLQTLVVPLFSYVMLDILHINYQTVSILTIVQTISMMASFYVWGNLNAKFSNRTLLFWTLPIIALSCMVWGLVSILPMFFVLVISHMLLGAGVGGFNQLVFNFTIGDTPKSERPMFIAMYAAITGVTSFLGPVIGGQIYKIIGVLPSWVQEYGLQTIVGTIMLLVALTLGRKILKET
ncbi:MFS transporter [Paenibacillus crassostreae]|uniref:MFS transporter n=1 Tax=Paenibacillus crassostreae TaxID=1763538 RepID=A0A167BSM7_9BACL|nr:MFS transporter [Paenibacillus crassostreae]OAB72399.1 MFS transporter [Paenibacillus crassostreae]